MPNLNKEEQELLRLARAVIRDQAFDYDERHLAADPRVVCDRLSAMIGETYDFPTGDCTGAAP